MVNSASYNFRANFNFVIDGYENDFTPLVSDSEENSEENHFFIVFFTRGENSEEKS